MTDEITRLTNGCSIDDTDSLNLYWINRSIYPPSKDSYVVRYRINSDNVTRICLAEWIPYLNSFDIEYCNIQVLEYSSIPADW